MKIIGAIFAKQYEWQDKPDYSFFQCHGTDPVQWLEDMQKQEYVYICAHEVEFRELSHDHFVAAQINSLRKKKVALQESFTQQTRAVDDRIQNLLAISYSPTPAVNEPDDDIPF
jgi:hypothetical protein